MVLLEVVGGGMRGSRVCVHFFCVLVLMSNVLLWPASSCSCNEVIVRHEMRVTVCWVAQLVQLGGGCWLWRGFISELFTRTVNHYLRFETVWQQAEFISTCCVTITNLCAFCWDFKCQTKTKTLTTFENIRKWFMFLISFENNDMMSS